MNDNAKKWIAALRSGEYRQTRKVLKDQIGYCCLGVACDLFQKEVGTLAIENLGCGTYFDGCVTRLPILVREWLGLKTSDGAIREGNLPSLVFANDNGVPFHAIADLIESEPLGLFRG